MSAIVVDTTTTAGSFAVRARFEAAAGITVLFGPSGSGKTLTLATIAGLLRPDTGTVTIHGRVVADPDRGVHVPTQQRRVGMVFQQAALLPHRSPLDNVALAVRDVPRRAGRRRVAGDLLARTGADHLAASPTSALSGGEQQRVALARALAGDPRALLLDEPFSALDQPSRTALRRLLRDLVDGLGIPAVLVTHDLDDTALADRVVRYEPGATTGTIERPPGAPIPFDELLGTHVPPPIA
jgi:molybdate transport system ATP-binding protein